MVMELLEGGALSELLAADVELPWNARLLIAGDIARGIQVLHTNKPQVTVVIIVINSIIAIAIIVLPYYYFASLVSILS